MLDSIALMGGAANSIMQLSRLAVGYGVMESKVDSGNIFKRPKKRTRTTLTYLAVAMLGTTEEKLAYRRAANTSHAQVRSEEGAPVQYNAFDPELQLWVAACLYWGFADMNERLYGKMSPEKAAEFYRLAEPLATTLQVRPGMWPQDLAAFNEFWEQGLAKTSMDDRLREHLTMLADMKFLSPAKQRLLGPINRFFTIGFLPPRIRELMQFEWTPVQQKRFDRAMAIIAFINRRLPRRVRQHTYLQMMRDLRRRIAAGMPLV
ncbi:MAG: oxygenase MpaB family protein [Gammaproteobacteria bacterium]